MKNKDNAVRTVARELADAFTSDTRNDGATFYKIADNAAAWVKRDGEDGTTIMLRIHRAVDDRLPDDWVYEAASLIASRLLECESIDAMRDDMSEIADGLVDVYNSDLTKWLSAHLGNLSLCDEAAEELGYDKDRGIIGLIQAGQYRALEAIGNQIVNEIEAESEAREVSAA